MTIQEQQEKIEQLEKDIEALKNANTLFLEQMEEEKKKKPEMLLKIIEIANKNGLNKKQKEELIQKCINMADEFRKKNKNNI